MSDSVVISLVVVEDPPRASHNAQQVEVTVRHGDRVTVTLDRDSGQIAEIAIVSRALWDVPATVSLADICANAECRHRRLVHRDGRCESLNTVTPCRCPGFVEGAHE